LQSSRRECRGHAAVIQYLVRRMLFTIPTLLGVFFLVFVTLRLGPGDPAYTLLGEYYTPEAYKAVRANLRLDDPLPVQFFSYLGAMLSGNLGQSYARKAPVTSVIAENLLPTALLALFSELGALLLGVAAGVLAGITYGSLLDRAVMFFSVTVFSMPFFWVGLLAIYLVSFRLGWLPLAGAGGPGVSSVISHLALPVVVLALRHGAVFARLVRIRLTETLYTDYVRTARAKGLPSRLVVLKHALRNSMIPVVTVAALDLGHLLSGTAITETVFSRPGLGSLMVNSVLQRDFPVVQAVTLLFGVFLILMTLVSDLLYGILDPRIRYA